MRLDDADQNAATTIARLDARGFEHRVRLADPPGRHSKKIEFSASRLLLRVSHEERSSSGSRPTVGAHAEVVGTGISRPHKEFVHRRGTARPLGQVRSLMRPLCPGAED